MQILLQSSVLCIHPHSTENVDQCEVLNQQHTQVFPMIAALLKEDVQYNTAALPDVSGLQKAWLTEECMECSSRSSTKPSSLLCSEDKAPFITCLCPRYVTELIRCLQSFMKWGAIRSTMLKQYCMSKLLARRIWSIGHNALSVDL